MVRALRSFFVLVGLVCLSYEGFSQSYIAMPADSGARWRYRIIDIDYITQIFDNIIFLNGKDTVAGGNTYHKLISRTLRQTGSPGFNPPVVDCSANYPDTYYGAYRESGKKVYSLTLSGEKLMYDFNVAVGDSIPAYLSRVAVTAIDSVLLSGVFHKRFLTANPDYYVIEGVGSSLGLIPDLNDGGSDIVFYCFTYDSVNFTPDSLLPCTYVYPIGYAASVNSFQPAADIRLYPNPASNYTHIAHDRNDDLDVTIQSCIGQVLWKGKPDSDNNIYLDKLPRGLYYIKIQDGAQVSCVRQLVIE